MSQNLRYYASVIQDHIEKYLVYNKDDPEKYSNVIKRATYCELLKRNVMFIHEIEDYIAEIEKIQIVKYCSDGSYQQEVFAKETKIQTARDIIKFLMQSPRIKETEEFK